jgi:hypothetical protein
MGERLKKTRRRPGTWYLPRAAHVQETIVLVGADGIEC